VSADVKLLQITCLHTNNLSKEKVCSFLVHFSFASELGKTFHQKSLVSLGLLKERLTRDFRLPLFHESVSPGPQSISFGPFRIFLKIMNESLSPVSTKPGISCSLVSTTSAIKEKKFEG
jgi:hypothetical protein